MKHITILLLLSVLAVMIGAHAFELAAHAEEPEPTPTPPDKVIALQAEPTPTPTPMQRPQAVVYDYKMGRTHIEAVARGMYGLDTPAEKFGFAFLVVNRACCTEKRADGKYLFARTIAEIVAQPGEFDFYDPGAPLTDENLDYAEFAINVQLTSILTKEYTGYAFPSTLLYMGWENGEVVFYTERGGEPFYMRGNGK